jgi:hypothetical protein
VANRRKRGKQGRRTRGQTAQPQQPLTQAPVERPAAPTPGPGRSPTTGIRNARDRLQGILSHGDSLIGRLRFPPLSHRWERWFGPNGFAWLVILSILPIAYVGFGLTVSVNGWGWPRNLYPWIDNDYWWHLAVGDWIIDRREMPSPDPWLFMYDGKFVAHEWLGEVFLSLTDRIGDYPAGIIATWIIAVAGFWVLMGAAHLYGLSWRACTIVTVLWMGVFLREGVFAVRPQMWTFTFYALLFFFIARYETGRTRHLWVLPPFFLVWMNTHLSAVIGLAAFGVFGLHRLVHRQPIRHLLIVGVLSLAGLIVNPFGFDYVDQIFRFGGRPEIWNERIFEWQAPVLSQWHNRGFVLAMVMVMPAVWQILRGRLWPAAIVVVFLQQALTSIRFVTPFVIFCVVFAGWLVWQHRQDVPDAWQPAPRPEPPRLWWVAVPNVAAAALVLVVALTYENSQFQREPYAWGYPVEAATIYEENFAEGRLFNTYDWGGYLDLRFNGDPQIYIDGRADTYPNALIERYFWIVDGSPGWDAMLNEDQIDVIMVRPIDGLSEAARAHPDWTLVYEDNWSVLFVRSSGVE